MGRAESRVEVEKRDEVVLVERRRARNMRR